MLHPMLRCGSIVTETLRGPDGRRLSRSARREEAVRRLAEVGIADPAVARRYPFELSGGMRQRAMIALGLCCSPKLLIADEPTTALDVTTQAVILDLVAELQAELGMAVMFITHDLGVVAQIADEVVVMYLGRVAERADVQTIFRSPRHPYTRALMRSIPRLGGSREPLESIRGMVPNPFRRPAGCNFNPRCPDCIPGVCTVVDPVARRFDDGSEVRCVLYASDEKELAK
jgi:peptide/nickel transport system ATP-binding protein